MVTSQFYAVSPFLLTLLFHVWAMGIPGVECHLLADGSILPSDCQGKLTLTIFVWAQSSLLGKTLHSSIRRISIVEMTRKGRGI